MTPPTTVTRSTESTTTHRLMLFLLFLVSGFLVFFVGGYFGAIPRGIRTVIKVGIPILFLALTVMLYRSERFKGYWQLALAFCAASFGFLTAWLLSDWVLSFLNVTPDTMTGLAVTKFVDAVLIALPIILIIKTVDGDIGALYLKRGKLKWSLLIGGSSFVFFAVLFCLQAQSLGIGFNRIVAWIPWILIFVLSNAFMEELHFRGLFLGRLEPFLGRGLANLAVAIVFTGVHAPVAYTPNIAPFLIILFFLALAWGYLIQKTDNLWGSLLFHAGADLLIIVGILQSLGGPK